MLTKGFIWATFAASTPRWVSPRDVRRMRLHASSCKTDWLRVWCQRQAKKETRLHLNYFYYRVCNNEYRCARLPVFHGLVTHRDGDGTVTGWIRHAPQYSLRDPISVVAVNIVIVRVIIHAYVASARSTTSEVAWRMRMVKCGAFLCVMSLHGCE